MRSNSLIVLSLVVLACGGGDKKSSVSTTQSPKRDSLAGTLSPTVAATAAPNAAVTPSATTDTTRRGGAPNAASKRADPDSAVMIVVASQPKHRTRADSFSLVATIRAGLKHPGWPVKGPAPLPNAIMPRKRIVAFYGNPLSKKMGVLGEYPTPVMLAKLDTMVAEWNAADPRTPVQPALHLIASVAQPEPGKDGMYRQRSDTGLIEKVYGWAKSKNAILFLDIQTGWSTIEAEIPRLIPFLSRPDVHLGIDPEFNMHYNREGRKPGAKIGALDAKDINHAIDQLAQLVTKYNLPPKVLIIHRFTKNMVQNASQIKLDPRVQVVMNMDGWGQPWLKFDTYKTCEVDEPVQFTGFKIFFHNDTKKGDPILAAREVLALRPRPMYIQYQ
jgi:hypothetical protein